MKVFCVLFFSILISLSPNVFGNDDVLSDVEKIFYDTQEISKRLHEILSKPETWENATYLKDKVKAERLMKYIKLSYTVRCEGIEKILVQHLDYHPYEGILEDKMRTFEQNNPVCYALSKVGKPAVKHLIKLLRTTEPSTKPANGVFYTEEEDNRNAKIYSAIQCLLLIYEYDDTKLVKKFVKAIIQNEIEKLFGKEKEFLQMVLNNPLLKD